jgi:hypothetical protein
MTAGDAAGLSGGSYVRVKLHEEVNDSSQPTLVKISSPERCNHVATVCTECVAQWEQDFKLYYNRTVGGRRLLRDSQH